MNVLVEKLLVQIYLDAIVLVVRTTVLPGELAVVR